MSTFETITTNAGSGGATFAVETFSQSGSTLTMAITALAYGSASAGFTVVGENASASLPIVITTGSAVIGAVTQSGTWNINNISGTISLPSGAATETTLAGIKTKTDGLTFSSTRLLVDGSGVTQPVSGTLTVNAGTNLNTSLLSLETTQTSVKTAVELLDDVIITDDAAFTPGTTKVTMIGATFDDSAPDSVNEGDAGAIRMSANRNLYVTLRDAEGNERGVYVDSSNRILASVTNTVTVSNSGTFVVQAAQSGTWNITNVTGTVTLPTGASTSAKQDTIIGHIDGIEALLTTIDADTSNLSVTGGGTESAAIRVTIANDSTGVLSVDDNGSSLTVDGTVSVTGLPSAATLADNTANPSTISLGSYILVYDGSTWDRARGDATDGLLVNLGSNNDVTVTGSVTANAGTNLNTSLLALESGGNLATATASLGVIDDWDESDRAKVNPIVGQAGLQGGSGSVSANTLRTVLATDVALPAGTNNIGDVDVLSVIPGTGTTNLGKAEDAGHSSGDTGVMMLAVQQTANTSLVGTNLDYAPLQVDDNGNLKVNIIAGAGSGGTAMTDDAAFTVATTSFTPIGGVYKSALDTLNDGDGGAAHLTEYRALHVNLRDAAGNELSVGGGTQYTEDAAAASNPIGNAIIVVRDDARGGSLTTTDGDNVALRGNNNGELYVKHTDSIAATQSGTWNITNVSGTVSLPTGAATSAKQDTEITSLQLIDDVIFVDDAAFTPGSSKIAMIGAEFDDSGPDSVDEGDAGALRMSANRNLYSTIRDAAGNERGANVNASNQLSVSVDNTVTVAAHAVTNAGTFAVQATIAASATNIAKAEDVAHSGGDTGVFVLAVRNDSGGTTFTSDDGDYSPIAVDSKGSVAINDGGNTITVDGTVSITANSAINVAQIAGNTAATGNGTSSSGTLRVAVASDNTAFSVNPQPVTSGGLSVYRNIDTNSTGANIKASAGQIYGYFLSNSGASAAYVKLYDKATTPTGSDTPILTLYIPAGSAANLNSAFGLACSNGIGIRAVSGVADNNTTSPSTNEVICNIYYK